MHYTLESLETRVLLSGDILVDDLVDGASGAGAGEMPLVAIEEVVPDPGGVSIQFDGRFDPESIELHSDAPGSKPDISLVGDAVGEVDGSLIVDSARTLRFIATGDLLVEDTYTLVVDGSAGGVLDEAGRAVDGDSDGEPGGDHVARFTVDASPAISVAVPDFARGRGQSVDLPATETGIPITIRGLGGLESILLALEHDVETLVVTEILRGEDLPVDALLSVTSTAPGRAVFRIESPGGLPGGDLELARVVAAVPVTAEAGSVRVLDLEVEEAFAVDDPLPVAVTARDGVQVVAFLGDASGNEDYSAMDAQRVLRVAVGLDSGFAAFPRVDPSIVADVTANGSSSALDATRIAQAAADIDRPEIPPRDLLAPLVLLALADDSGDSLDDLVTRVPDIEGRVFDVSPITRLTLAIPELGASELEINSALDADGVFRVDRAALETLVGQALPDGSLTYRVVAEDTNGLVSESAELIVTLDTRAPEIAFAPEGNVRSILESSALVFSEAMGSDAFVADSYEVSQIGPVDPVGPTSVERLSMTTAGLEFTPALDDGAYTLSVSGALTDLAGNPLTGPTEFSFSISKAPRIASLSPTAGEEMVNVTRETVLRFDEPIDAATVTIESFRLDAAGSPVAGRVVVSSTGRFATYFYDNPLPPSTAIQLRIDGDVIRGLDGDLLDADGDGEPGGVLLASFSTLPLTRIPGTNLFGVVRDSYTGVPIVGATIRVDAFPEANAVTDAAGRFELVDMPAPEFFVHIDGSTATNAPPGFEYPNVGKPFHSVPGRTIPIGAVRGAPFDVFLPSISSTDMQPLSAEGTTDVGFGSTGLAIAEALFPDIDRATLGLLSVTFPPGSAVDEFGAPAGFAVVVPVPPDRLPTPLPSGMDPSLVVSIQAPGATNFDVPAPITFPNLDGLAPGERSLIVSFNHDAGRWESVGTGTVSEDGRSIVSDPGVGIRAPGWHVPLPGSEATPDPDPECEPRIGFPIPRIEGLEDRFLVSDADDGLRVRFANDGTPDPCGALLTIRVEVDGPAAEFLDGISQSVSFTIRGGSDRDLRITPKALVGTPDFLALNHDVLFGARITVTALNARGVVLEQRVADVYRYLDASDLDPGDGVLHFAHTLADGSDGVTRARPVTLHSHGGAAPLIDVTTDAFRYSDSEGAFIFDPARPGDAKRGTVAIDIPDRGKRIEGLKVEGDATPRFRIDMNSAGFSELLQRISEGDDFGGDIEPLLLVADDTHFHLSPLVISVGANP